VSGRRPHSLGGWPLFPPPGLPGEGRTRLWNSAMAVVICLTMLGARVQGAPATQPVSTSAALPHTALGDEPLRPAAQKPSPSSAHAPDAAQPTGMDYPRVVAALALVIAMIFLLRWCSRFFFRGATRRGGSRAVEVLARSAVSPRQQVMLLRVGRRIIVVGESGAQMNTLCEIADSDEVAALVGQLRDQSTPPATKAFGALFGRSRRRFDEPDDQTESPAPPLVEPEEEPAERSTRQELSGLRERVRLLAEQFKTS